jgi:hypothetical protein
MNSNLSLTDDLWQSTLLLFQELVLQTQFPGFAFELTEPGSLTHRQRRLFPGVLTPMGIDPVPQGRLMNTELLGHLRDRTGRLDHQLLPGTQASNSSLIAPTRSLSDDPELGGVAVRKVRGTSIAGAAAMPGGAVWFVPPRRQSVRSD